MGSFWLSVATSTGNVDTEIGKAKNRESYMSANVLLNLLNKLGKSDKMRGLPSI